MRTLNMLYKTSAFNVKPLTQIRTGVNTPLTQRRMNSRRRVNPVNNNPGFSINRVAKGVAVGGGLMSAGTAMS